MLRQTRVTADRGDSPLSYDSFTDGEDVQKDVSSEVGDKPKAHWAHDYDNNLQRAEELSEDEDASELENSLAPDTGTGSISFGALARAQASLVQADRKAINNSSTGASPYDTSSPSTRFDSSKVGRREQMHQPRLSKHAPTEMTSKRAVSRKRPVVPVPKRDIRDPRFESALGPINEQKVKSNYAFLEGYRENEMKILKAELKKTKNDVERERLKKEILRMESRKGAQERKDAEQEVLRRHRKEERVKIESGKAPFYLKKAQVKKEALVERYGRMKGKEVDKLIERRRKKKASREKRHMPQERRAGVT